MEVSARPKSVQILVPATSPFAAHRPPVLVQMVLTIGVPGSYDLLSSVHAWVFPDIQPVPEITWRGGLGKVFTFDRMQVPILVLQDSPGARLHVEYDSNSVSALDVRKKIRRILGLDVDISGALKHIVDDPTIHAIEPTVRGIRPYCTDTVFEALVKAIVQQQVSYRAASVLTQRLTVNLGTLSKLQNRVLYAFPTPATILEGGRVKLSDCGFGFKTDYVYDVCSIIDSGQLDVERLFGKTAADAREALAGLRGIGKWTINALAVSGLGDFSTFPYDDLGMRNLLGRLYNKGARMTESQVIENVKSWGPDGPLVLYLLMCAHVLGAVGPAGRPKTHKRRPSKADCEP